MDIIFETGLGKPFVIEVGFFDTVFEIKEKVQKYQGIPVPRQTLVFKNQVLQDDRDIEQCELLNNSHVRLIVAQEPEKPQIKTEPVVNSVPSPVKKVIQLNVRIPSSKTCVPVEMDVNDTVLRLKEKIHEMESVPINRLIVQSSGMELQDQRSLRECELPENAEIDVNVRPSPTSSGSGSGGGSKKLKVMVLPKCGPNKIPVEVNPTDNVGELRKELQKLQSRLQFHLPPEGYFFIYKQNVMDDDRTFRWHQVGQGDTIEIFNGSVTGGS